ncbi:uncharacterized protein BDR25DRAFT_289095 [Lindgomyces ingoldianus]|uniref:Uncharacterized protein n=1 Tax=Lindgomyces ingoldianus TaxID=673940 RepID=A0ACB6QT70_9PLEO|nr:uncharacterized protein BDR25DRAFT_289095 [Lindgomyces ingoldianus]KAF2469497.1 hypothetical protein BDR25DRAFT_289095 [Lindgomyces ingoldianus]
MSLSLPTPPFYAIPNINNLRDAALFPGGLPTTTGGKVRPGILFRSADVSQLDRGGWKAMREIGIGHVFDLRSKPEVEKEGVDVDPMGVRPGWIQMMEAEGVERTWVPVFEESDYSPERLAERYLKYMGEGVEGFVQAYHDILLHAGTSFRTILLYLANLPPPTPIPTLDTPKPSTFLSNDPSAPTPQITTTNQPLGALIHCTAGKDRTGIFFGILLSFLGVPIPTIAAEYNLTETGLQHARDGLVARLMKSPGFKKYTLTQMAGREMKSAGGAGEGEMEKEIPKEVLEKGRKAALRMVGARVESMVEALGMVEREWGSAEGYLRRVCGLGDEELEDIRRVLVVGG